MSRLAAIALALLAACGGTSRTTRTGRVEAPKLPKADPDALAQFDAGMRALRLGGPEARERARPRLERAVELDAKLWEGWHNLGVVAYEDGDDDAAVAAFGRAIDINPAHTPSLLSRAEAHRRARDYDKARDDYRTAISRDPDNAAIHIRHASLLREQGRLDDALDAAREALRHSNEPKVFVEVGLIYLAQGRDELAQLVLEKALAADAKLPAAWNALALVSMARGRDQDAFEQFDRASSADATFVDARFNKAHVLMQAGDYGAARSELEAVLKQKPDDHGALVALGVAFRGADDLVRARRTWEDVVKRAPKRSGAAADALFNLAVLAMDFGDRDEAQAREALDRYLQNAPKRHARYKQAQERRKELGQ
jgi:Tfp pilus assembly protein PilF